MFIKSQTASLPPLLIILNLPFSSRQHTAAAVTAYRASGENTERNREDRDWIKDRWGKRAVKREPGREKGSDKVRESEREGSRQRDGCSRVAEVRRWCND